MTHVSLNKDLGGSISPSRCALYTRDAPSISSVEIAGSREPACVLPESGERWLQGS